MTASLVDCFSFSADVHGENKLDCVWNLSVSVRRQAENRNGPGHPIADTRQFELQRHEDDHWMLIDSSDSELCVLNGRMCANNHGCCLRD